MSVSVEIRAALEKRLASVSGIPAADQRSYENVPFKPTTGTTWIRTSVRYSTIRPSVMGPNPQLRFDGLFLVDVFAPENLGAGAAETLADAIRNAYTVDDTLTEGSTNVRFQWSERAGAIADSPWLLVPVSIQWYTYSTS